MIEINVNDMFKCPHLKINYIYGDKDIIKHCVSYVQMFMKDYCTPVHEKDPPKRHSFIYILHLQIRVILHLLYTYIYIYGGVRFKLYEQLCHTVVLIRRQIGIIKVARIYLQVGQFACLYSLCYIYKHVYIQSVIGIILAC